MSCQKSSDAFPAVWTYRGSQRFGASQCQACRVLKLSRSVYSYQSIARDSSAIVLRIKQITQTRVHSGYRWVHMMLRRQGWGDNKRVYWLYREQELSLRHKKPRRNKAARLKQLKQIMTVINEIWSVDLSLTHCMTAGVCAR